MSHTDDTPTSDSTWTEDELEPFENLKDTAENPDVRKLCRLVLQEVDSSEVAN